MINLYGQQEGTKKFDSYRKKQADTNSFQYKKQKYGYTKQQFDEYNKNRAVTLELSIKRHGIQNGTKIYNDYCQRQAYAGCKLQYFQQKYGIEDGTRIYKEIGKCKARNLQQFVIENGEDIGNIKYQQYINKIRKHLLSLNKKYSKVSQQLFLYIYQKLPELNSQFFFPQHPINSKEWIVSVSSFFYFLDFYDKKTKKVIEFYGNFWHADPKKYLEQDLVYIPNNSKFAKEIWKKDQERINNILSSKQISDVLIIWQSQYNEDKNNTVKKCIQFLIK